MFIVAYFIAIYFKCWCQFSEDVEIIAPKHAEAMQKTVRIDYGTMHLLVLCELFT